MYSVLLSIWLWNMLLIDSNHDMKFNRSRRATKKHWERGEEKSRWEKRAHVCEADIVSNDVSELLNLRNYSFSRSRLSATDRKKIHRNDVCAFLLFSPRESETKECCRQSPLVLRITFGVKANLVFLFVSNFNSNKEKSDRSNDQTCGWKSLLFSIRINLIESTKYCSAVSPTSTHSPP